MNGMTLRGIGFTAFLIVVIALGFVGLPMAFHSNVGSKEFYVAFGGGAMAIIATVLLADRFGYISTTEKPDEKPKGNANATVVSSADGQQWINDARLQRALRGDPNVS